jgi:hypothetical protein
MIADEQAALRYIVSSDGPGRILEQVQTDTGQGPCVDTYLNNQVVTSRGRAGRTRRQVTPGLTPTRRGPPGPAEPLRGRGVERRCAVREHRLLATEEEAARLARPGWPKRAAWCSR